jgi:hypothetical protein
LACALRRHGFAVTPAPKEAVLLACAGLEKRAVARALNPLAMLRPKSGAFAVGLDRGNEFGEASFA